MTDSTGLSRRGFLQATGGAAAAVSLAGCLGGNDGSGDGNGGGGGGGTSTPKPEKGGTLNLILTGTIDTFDPVAADDTASGEVIQQVFDPLTNYPSAEVETKPLLAKEIKTNKDKTKYTFTLQKGATFHNGDPVTAKDVVYSFERIAGSNHSVRMDFILGSMGVTHETDSDGNYKPGTLGVTAKDKHTVEMQLERPFHATLQVLAYSAFAVVPEGIVGSLEDEGTYQNPSKQYKKFANTNPVGAGPFTFKQWSKQSDAAVTKFDDYYGEGPYVDGVHWQVIEKDSAAYNYAIGGDADMFEIPTSKYNPSKVSVENTDEKERKTGTYGPVQGNTFNYRRIPEVGTYYVAFNAGNVPKPVRKAVAYTLNPKAIRQQITKQRYPTAYHLTPELIYPGGKEAYDKHVEKKYPYSAGENDLKNAKKVMKQAGYGPNNRFKLKFTHYQNRIYKQLGKTLQQRLKGAFIDLSINQAKFQTLIQTAENGNNELYSLGWVADWPKPDNFMKLLYPPNTHTGDPSSYTYLNWGRDSPTKASKKAKTAFETIQKNLKPTDQAQKKRNQAYIKMEEANWEDAMVLPTHHSATEFFYYQDTHYEKIGGMGRSRNKYNDTWKEQS